jgi:hypothetical protein
LVNAAGVSGHGAVDGEGCSIDDGRFAITPNRLLRPSGS